MARSPAAKALEAAAELDAWLARNPPRPSPPGPGEPLGNALRRCRPCGDGSPAAMGENSVRVPPPAGTRAAGGAREGSTAPSHPFPDAPARDGPDAAREAAHPPTPMSEVLAPAHTDWLYHHLTVAGASGDMARFRAAAAGAGVVPWAMDWDRLEEDWAHLLLAPPPPQRRTLSAAGARVLAGELREAAQRRHVAALARVGRSRACPFDLHALVPVPADVLALGPDHPDALAWLWAHWGTTQPLRHVQVRGDVADGPDQATVKTRRPPPRVEPRVSPGRDTMHLAFWSADWTPWRAIARLRQDWPTLRLDVHPIYEPGRA